MSLAGVDHVEVGHRAAVCRVEERVHQRAADGGLADPILAKDAGDSVQGIEIDGVALAVSERVVEFQLPDGPASVRLRIVTFQTIAVMLGLLDDSSLELLAEVLLGVVLQDEICKGIGVSEIDGFDGACVEIRRPYLLLRVELEDDFTGIPLLAQGCMKLLDVCLADWFVRPDAESCTFRVFFSEVHETADGAGPIERDEGRMVSHIDVLVAEIFAGIDVPDAEPLANGLAVVLLNCGAAVENSAILAEDLTLVDVSEHHEIVAVEYRDVDVSIDDPVVIGGAPKDRAVEESDVHLARGGTDGAPALGVERTEVSDINALVVRELTGPLEQFETFQ